MEFTVVGAGAIGGVLGAYLARAGHDVTLCDKDEDHVEAVNENGLRIEGDQETFTVLVPAVTPDELVAREHPLRTVLLCVKSQDTRRALQPLLHLCDERTQVVSCQNGLCEDIIAELVGRERTIGCFVNFSADYLGPGRILYAGVSSFVLGELDGPITQRLQDIQSALSAWGPVEITDNIWGYLWGKLSYAALLFATAMTNATMAEVVRSLPHRQALVELTAEVLDVAARQDITPMGFDDWEPVLVHPRMSRDDEALAEQWERLAVRMAASKKPRSGVWRDLAVRKRHTEVDFQLVPVTVLGEQFGLELPLTRYVIDNIHDLERGGELGWDRLDGLKARYEALYGRHEQPLT
ncbi:ketopantoate reductase family protein [Alicyclobacillus sp. ALC3]|uniref:ketopantoate reductase family protein n=1 Tax=Alicyclobacillus sp. ALC3 TaxID=2796143 RepID=UPI002379A4BA|nr:2-dehydropantoate 2-reductase [Alicyclobacillus sp. ALC3]WDL98427.1 2-dehydropantoate 2-reductase [Alicyclobacillus sp. ALC3]